MFLGQVIIHGPGRETVFKDEVVIGPRAADMPGNKVAFVIQPGLVTYLIRGAVGSLRHVVFAGIDQFDGGLHLFGDHGGLHGEGAV